MDDEIEATIRRCNALVQRIHSLPHSKISPSCKNTLLRLVNSELTFLSRLSLSPKPFSCNIGYVEAIVHLLQQPCITKVSRVCKPTTLSSLTSYEENCSTQSEAVHIDIICTINNSPAWFIVSDRNPKYITWDISGRNKGLKLRIEQIIHAAQCSQALMPAFIILFFANGLESSVQHKLEKEFSFEGSNLELSNIIIDFSEMLEGEWVNVLVKSYQGASTLVLDMHKFRNPDHTLDSGAKLRLNGVCYESPEMSTQVGFGSSFQSLILRMKEWPLDVKDLLSETKEDILRNGDIVNFDTTAVIALISGLSNGGAEKLLKIPEIVLRQRFKSNTDFVISQAQSEIESPILDELHCILSAKKGLICKTVHSEVMEIVTMCGGYNELMRANQLVKHLKIVPDSPSQRMMSLPTTRKLALKNKVAFGTGDYWCAPTLTANMGFVRAVAQSGMPLFTIEHRSRALIGD